MTYCAIDVEGVRALVEAVEQARTAVSQERGWLTSTWSRYELGATSGQGTLDDLERWLDSSAVMLRRRLSLAEQMQSASPKLGNDVYLDESRISARTREQAEQDATDALAALRSGDMATLDRLLAQGAGDPFFAYSFTSRATPRELGDFLATVADPDHSAPLDPDVDPDQYERVLDGLADTLSLATHGTGDLALPKSWTDDFTRYTTIPQLTNGNQDSDDLDRVMQDIANKQNLLLLLSRGHWSTDFLKATTRAYWDWEHQTDLPQIGGPWPGPDLGATYAPAPNGTYLTDGMVALMAALTANPEAAKWAFTDFQPGTTSVEFGGEDHPMGDFAHYVFFEHDYDTLAEDSGMTASVTALMSAISVDGGTSVDPATMTCRLNEPMRDADVLQRFMDDQAEQQAEWDAKPWYEKWGHTILDAISMIPVIGIPADVASGVWSAIESDWAGAGLSAAGMIPFYGDAIESLKVFRSSLKSLRVLDKLGNVVNPVFKFAKTDGLTPELRAQILATQKGLRPDPATYLDPGYIDRQLDQFAGGATRLMPKGNYAKYGPGQVDGTSFVFPTSQIDDLIATTKGDPRLMEEALGLPDGFLDGDIVRVDIKDPGAGDLRIPSGNEAGASDQWLPGGHLPTGISEAVLDIPKIDPGAIDATPFKPAKP